jgi:hypothetical protein
MRQLGSPKISALAIAAATIVLAGCVPADSSSDDPSGQPAAVTNATRDTTHPEVVQIFATDTSNNVLRISGVLVGPSAVLTSAMWLGSRMPATPVYVNAEGPSVTQAQVLGEPVLQGSSDDQRISTGLAILRLDRKVPDVMPARFDRMGLQSGEAIRVVGFGRVPAITGPTARRVGENTVDALLADDFNFDAWPYWSNEALACDGDIGGGIFVTNAGDDALAGIVWDASCSRSIAHPGGESVALRVDANNATNQAWVQTTLQ